MSSQIAFSTYTKFITLETLIIIQLVRYLFKPIELKTRAMRFILQLILMAVAIMITAYIVPGVEITSFWTALLAGILIAFVNTVLGGILRLLTFPINFLTLGLMSFVITVLMIMLVDSMMSSFNVGGFWITALFAIVLAVIQILFDRLFNRGSS